MTKTEYKAKTLRASPGFGTVKALNKFDESITTQLNEISSELRAEGWELATMFAVSLEGAYTVVFKRVVKGD